MSSSYWITTLTYYLNVRGKCGVVSCYSESGTRGVVIDGILVKGPWNTIILPHIMACLPFYDVLNRTLNGKNEIQVSLWDWPETLQVEISGKPNYTPGLYFRPKETALLPGEWCPTDAPESDQILFFPWFRRGDIRRHSPEVGKGGRHFFQPLSCPLLLPGYCPWRIMSETCGRPTITSSFILIILFCSCFSYYRKRKGGW